jgi:hypothetical protein
MGVFLVSTLLRSMSARRFTRQQLEKSWWNLESVRSLRCWGWHSMFLHVCVIPIEAGKSMVLNNGNRWNWTYDSFPLERVSNSIYLYLSIYLLSSHDAFTDNSVPTLEFPLSVETRFIIRHLSYLSSCKSQRRWLITLLGSLCSGSWRGSLVGSSTITSRSLLKFS